MQEYPGLLHALAAALENLADGLGKRQRVEHVVEAHTARGDFALRQRLDPHLAHRDRRAEAADQELQKGVNRGSGAAGVVKNRDQEYEPHAGEANALDNAQRAGLEVHAVLQVVRPAEEPEAG